MYKPQKAHLESGVPFHPKLRGQKPITISKSWVPKTPKLVVPRKAACRECLASKFLVLEAVHVVALWVALVQQLLMDNFSENGGFSCGSLQGSGLSLWWKKHESSKKVTSPENHLFSPPKTKKTLPNFAPFLLHRQHTKKHPKIRPKSLQRRSEWCWGLVQHSRFTAFSRSLVGRLDLILGKKDFFLLGNQKKKNHR